MIMKRAFNIFSVLFLALVVPSLFAQAPFGTANRIRPLAALPATCNPLNGDVVMLTAGAGISPGVYNCTILNTWRPIGVQGNQYNLAQGTITANQPGINQSVTWNNGAVQFYAMDMNITDTASAANSILFRYRVSGVVALYAEKSGQLFSASNIIAGMTSRLGFNSRGGITAPADGTLNLLNQASSGFTELNFGPAAVTQPSIIATAAVGGQAQGITIAKGDGTFNVFADLGAAANGTITYCSNCTIASPCAGGGTGAIAKRLNGAWVCN